MYIYEHDDDLTYLVVVERGYDKIAAFRMLEKLKAVFNQSFTKAELERATPYQFNQRFKKTLQELFEENTKSEGDKINQIKVGMDKTKDVLNNNVKLLAERDSNLDSLQDKTHDLSTTSYTIKKESTAIKRNVLCRKRIFYIGGAIIAILLIYGMFSLFCGFDGKKCFEKSKEKENSDKDNQIFIKKSMKQNFGGIQRKFYIDNF